MAKYYTMERETIERVLSRNATSEEAHRVAEWFATDEGQAYLSQLFDEEADKLNDETTEECYRHEIPTQRMRDAFLSKIFKK